MQDSKDIVIPSNIVDIFKYASPKNFGNISEFVFGISRKDNIEENIQDILATILPVYYKSNTVIYNKFKMYLLLIELVNLSMKSFAGKTLLDKFDKNAHRKELIEYQMLCLKNKCIFILDEYDNKKYLIKITVNIKNFGNWFEELKVYPLNEIGDQIEIGYEPFLYDSEIIDKLPLRYLKEFKSLSSLTSLYSVKGYTKLYKSLLEILPNKYCHYCNADPRLKNNYDEDAYLSTGTLTYNGKGNSCTICKLIFEQIKNFRYRHILNHKTGKFEIIEFRNKNNNEDALDYENILCIINKKCKEIKNVDETFYKQKRKIVGECILKYDIFSKILEDKLHLLNSHPEIFESMKNRKPKYMNLNFYKFIKTVKYHFDLEKYSEQAYFEQKYLYSVNNF